MTTHQDSLCRILDQSLSEIHIYSSESLKILYANSSALNRLGYTIEELKQMSALDISPGFTMTSFRDLVSPLSETTDNSASVTFETELQDKNASRYPTEIRLQQGTYQDSPVYIASIFNRGARPTTETSTLEQKVAERTQQLQCEIDHLRKIEARQKLNEERLHDIATSSTDGFWETDSTLEFVLFNQTFTDLAGPSADSFTSLTYSGISKGVYTAEQWQAYLHSLAEHLPFRNFQFKLEHATQEPRYISMSGIPVFDSEQIFKGYRGTVTDITKQIKAKRIAARTQEELHLAKEEAEKASLAKSQFLESMSHELRTPLNCILGFAQLLEISEENLDEKQIRHVQNILSSGEHLLNLITDVLELNTIQEGRMSLKIEDVETDSILDDCLNQIEFRADEKNITLVDQRDRGHALPILWADIVRVKQLLLNLLSNAIKFNKEGGTVTISCNIVTDNMLRISIADTGTGISAEQGNKLFTPFDRLGRETGPIEGTGVGLSIAKRIVELLEGNIGYESEVGIGSTFWIELPLSAGQDLKESKYISRNRTVEQDGKFGISNVKTILYIEDDPDNQNLLTQVLTNIPSVRIKMLSAHNAELGVDLARTHQPDIIVLDINLPGMNGIEAVQELKCMPETKNIPVIAMSADVTPHAIDTAMSYGFEAYMTKPIRVKEIQNTISQLLDTTAVE